MTNEISQSTNLRTLIVSALGLAVTIWDVAFNLGAHGTIFYNKLFMLWVAATVILLCILLERDNAELQIGRAGMLALFAPTIWFMFNALTPDDTISWLNEFFWIIALIIFVIAVPYILYVLFQLFESDAVGMSVTYRNRLIMIAIMVSIAGLLVGRFNGHFVSCQQFQIAGDHPPANCSEWTYE